jgi:O-antigen ligase
MAAAFILIQIPIILMQTFGINDILWNSGKAGSYTGIFRVVGTVQNPNSLGIITVFCIIIFTYYYKEKPFWSKVFIGLCVLIVFATGSRTALIVLILLPVAFITKEKLFSRKIIYVIVGVFLILTLFYLVLLQLKETLPYMSQILNLVQFKSVHTLNTRFAHWRHVKHLYSLASLKVKLFGFGPGYFNVLDNSYLYVLYNYGIIAVVSFFVLLFMLFRTSVKTRVKLAQRSLFILLICGLVADVMLNFLLMSIIFYFIGMQAYTGLQENALEPAINNIKR